MFHKKHHPCVSLDMVRRLHERVSLVREDFSIVSDVYCYVFNLLGAGVEIRYKKLVKFFLVSGLLQVIRLERGWYLKIWWEC